MSLSQGILHSARAIARHQREIVSDLMILTGSGGLVYGVSLFSEPAAWCVAGVLLGAYGVLLGRSR